jgi:hypothetical protein
MLLKKKNQKKIRSLKYDGIRFKYKGAETVYTIKHSDKVKDGCIVVWNFGQTTYTSISIEDNFNSGQWIKLTIDA